MTMHPQHEPMAENDYLLLDRNSEDIHYEYIEGSIFALAGGTLAHARISSNIEAHLNQTLDGTPCQAYGKEARTQVAQGNNRKRGSYLYPDVVVTCDIADNATNHTDIIISPRIVFEILSDSTEGRDRGIKALLYRNCPTIQEIVYVHQDQRMAEVVTRTGQEWKTTIYANNDTLYLASLDLYIEMDTIYHRVRFA